MSTPWRTKIINQEIPCARDGGCTERFPGCHDQCPKWQKYLVKREERHKQRLKEETDEELFYHLVYKTNARVCKRKKHMPKRNPYKG